MNKEITVIDLFKRIEKHEDIPQKIKYKDSCYMFKHTNYSIDHLYELIGHECIGWLEHKDINLFDEVEILEDNTEEIEELNIDIKNYISKDKIKPKIEELEKEQEDNRKRLYNAVNNLCFKEMDKISNKICVNMTVRDILQSLLEEE